jgi:hypothetical protein
MEMGLRVDHQDAGHDPARPDALEHARDGREHGMRHAMVGRILRRFGLKPHIGRPFTISAAEKPRIQALEFYASSRDSILSSHAPPIASAHALVVGVRRLHR